MCCYTHIYFSLRQHTQRKYNAGNRRIILQFLHRFNVSHIPTPPVGILSASRQKRRTIMKSVPEAPTKKRKRTISLFAEAVAYRVPLPVTKIIVYGDNTAYPICPKCAMALEREYMSFCDRCGQKLNWNLFEYARVVRPGFRRK